MARLFKLDFIRTSPGFETYSFVSLRMLTGSTACLLTKTFAGLQTAGGVVKESVAVCTRRRQSATVLTRSMRMWSAVALEKSEACNLGIEYKGYDLEGITVHGSYWAS